MLSFAVLAVVGIIILTGALVALIMDFFATKDPRSSVSEAAGKYTAMRLKYFRGLIVSLRLEKAVRNVKKSQDTILQSLLQFNRDTMYSTKHGLNPAVITDRDIFRRTHPLSSKDNFRAYYSRMSNMGQKMIMTASEPVQWGITSGTTGQPGLMPHVQQQKDDIADFDAYTLYRLASQVPALTKLHQRMAVFANPNRETRTSSGIPLGPITAAYYFLDQENFTTPLGGANIRDEPSLRYVHLLFGLHNRNIRFLESSFAAYLYVALRDMTLKWKELVHDIRLGTLNQELTIEPDMRKMLEAQLKPNPKRAQELEDHFSMGNKYIVNRVWPKLELIQVVTTGVFVQYADIIREKYLDRDVLMFHPAYGATEGWLGLNMWPTRNDPTAYLLWPTINFYEFIPFEHASDENPETLFMDQLHVGEEYELVLTTIAGLWRYRLGDLIRVVEFYHECPVVEIVSRTGQLLNMTGEKVTDTAIYEALRKTLPKGFSKYLAGDILEFTCCESVFLTDVAPDNERAKTPNYYFVFLELAVKENEDIIDLNRRLSQRIDAELINIHSIYKIVRGKENVGPLRVMTVPVGTLQKLRTYILENSNASAIQVKVPRVLRKPELARFMLTQVYGGKQISDRKQSIF